MQQRNFCTLVYTRYVQFGRALLLGPCPGTKVTTAACRGPQMDCRPVICVVIILFIHVFLAGGGGSSRGS